MANLTRRQRIRLRSYLNLLIVLGIVLIVLIGAILLIARGIRNRSGGEVRAAGVSEAFVPQEIEEVAPEPTPTPEPTPAPPEADVASWELRLVRSDTPLPSDYEPELMEIENGQYFDARAGMHLQKLISDARDAGYTVFVCSGYRSYDTQYYLYWNHVDDYMTQGMTQEEAEAATRVAVNYPGGSEHQLGLAADLLEFQGQDMEPYIGGSGLMLWLEEHCADYGFIIRYPEDKTDITGVEYEPWHLRYVGAIAGYIMSHDLCLEEFLALYE